MKDTITKGSHFIWRKYLEQFSINNILWIYDKKNHIFFKNKTDNVAKKNNIYKFDTSFKALDRAVCRAFIENSFNKKVLESITEDLICFLENDFQQLLNSLSINMRIVNLLKRENRFIQYLDNQERLYSFYEENFKSILCSLLKEDASFYVTSEDIVTDSLFYSEVYYFEMSMFFKKEIALFLTYLKDPPAELVAIQRKIEEEAQKFKEDTLQRVPEIKRFQGNFYFTQFVFSQYSRTQKHFNGIKKRWEQLDEYRKQRINPQVLVAFGTHILPYNQTISCNQDRQHIVFLKNISSFNFITGDQPIINTIPNDKNNHIELYYPISTKLAILFTSGDRYKGIKKIELSESDVINWNQLIIDEAEHFVYAKDLSDLQKSNLIS